MLSAALSTGLVAQSDRRGTPTNPACPLLTDQELDTATGLDYPGGTIDVSQGRHGLTPSAASADGRCPVTGRSGCTKRPGAAPGRFVHSPVSAYSSSPTSAAASG